METNPFRLSRAGPGGPSTLYVAASSPPGGFVSCTDPAQAMVFADARELVAWYAGLSAVDAMRLDRGGYGPEPGADPGPAGPAARGVVDLSDAAGLALAGRLESARRRLADEAADGPYRSAALVAAAEAGGDLTVWLEDRRAAGLEAAVDTGSQVHLLISGRLRSLDTGDAGPAQRRPGC